MKKHTQVTVRFSSMSECLHGLADTLGKHESTTPPPWWEGFKLWYHAMRRNPKNRLDFHPDVTQIKLKLLDPREEQPPDPSGLFTREDTP